MKKILFVEDDALIARVYSLKLAAEGFEVVIAEDGLVAVQRLREFKPDLVVLDLLMPKLTGVDVLKFMRQHAELKDTRIIVFSNSFLGNLIEQVTSIGVEEALVKASVTPSQLVTVIHKVFQRPARTFLSADAMAAHLAGTVRAESPADAVAKPVPKPVAAKPVSVLPNLPPAPSREASNNSDFEARAQKEFFDKVPGILASMRHTCRDFLEAGNSAIEPRKLEDLRRKIGFVGQTLGLAGRHQFARLASALEAMLFELEGKSASITDSHRHTIAATIAFFAEHLDHAPPEEKQKIPPIRILVVDDDQVSSRAVVLALGRASLAAAAVADPFDALKRLRENSYSVVLLDINMPGMDGLTLCEHLRGLPLHKKTPVIFVTSQADFKTRARSVLSGGNELIAKPIMPTELCVKALAYLLKNQFGEERVAR